MDVYIAYLIALVTGLLAGVAWLYRLLLKERGALKTLTHCSGDTIFVIDFTGHALSCINDNKERSKSTIMHHFQEGNDIFQWFDASSRRTLQEELKALSNGGTPRNMMLHIMGEDVENGVTISKTADSNCYMLVHPASVNTRNVKELQNKANLMEILLNNLPIPASIKESTNRTSYLIWNHKAVDLYEMTKEDIREKGMDSLMPALAQENVNSDREVMKNGEYSGLINLPMANGDTHTLIQQKKLVNSQDGRKWIIATELDITKQERQRLQLEEKEKDLQEALQQAALNNRLKSELISNISHEIRTPLNAIVGFSQYMADTEDANERHQVAENISVNAQNLVELIDGIIDLNEIETGERKTDIRTINLHHLINQAMNGGQLANSKGLAMLTDMPEQEYAIKADMASVSTVLNNFLSNALKYTDSGSITAGYKITLHSVTIFVQDTGIGIDKDKRELVFERFEKNGSMRPGIGIGLAICKALVKQMGGNIGVNSTLGHGSTFWMELPYVPTPC